MEDKFTEEGIEEKEVTQAYPFPYGLDPSLLKWQLDNKQTLEELRHQLKGEALIDNEWNKIGKALMNEEGVRWAVTMVAAHMSKDKMLTNFKDEEVNRMCREVRLATIHHLTMNYDKYDIDKADLDAIVLIVDHHVFASLKRSMSMATLEFMKPQIRRTEIIKPSEEKKRSKLFGWLPFSGG